MKQLIPIVIFTCLNLSLASQTINKAWLDQIIETVCYAYNKPQSPGVGVSVIQNGKVITRKNYGMSNLEQSIPFTHQSPVREKHQLKYCERRTITVY